MHFFTCRQLIVAVLRMHLQFSVGVSSRSLLVDLDCVAPNRALDSNTHSLSLAHSLTKSTHFLTLSALCCTSAMILLQSVSTETS